MLSKIKSYISSILKPAPEAFQEIMSADTWLYPHSSPSPYNPDSLATIKGGLVIYDKMRRDDTIRACLGLKKYAVLSTGWSINPAVEIDTNKNEKLNEETAEFMRENIALMHGSFDDILLQMMTAFDYGFSVTEKIFDTRDNKIVIKALKTRKPHGITFDIDKFGNLLENGIIQAHYDHFPTKKFVIFTNNPEFNNWYGESDLRSCYRAWWSKDNVIKFWNMYLERYSMPPVIGRIKNTMANSPSDIAKLQDILKRLQTASSATIPEGVEVEFLETKGKGIISYKDSVSEHNLAMARALLVPNLLGVTAQGDTGSYSQSKTHFNVFLWIILRLRRALEELINEELIKELIDYNFRVEQYPTFKFLPLDDDKKIEVAKLWMEAANKGTVTPDNEDENLLRRILGWPEKEEKKIEDEDKEEDDEKDEEGKGKKYGGKGSGRYPAGSGGSKTVIELAKKSPIYKSANFRNFVNKGEAIPREDMVYDQNEGKAGDCEGNSYKYAKKNKLEYVAGYFNVEGDYWVQHAWVYDSKRNKHIEVTPLQGGDVGVGRIGRIVDSALLKVSLAKWGDLKDSSYITRRKKYIEIFAGKGSGDWGHSGRPGMVGGSGGGGGFVEAKTLDEAKKEFNKYCNKEIPRINKWEEKKQLLVYNNINRQCHDIQQWVDGRKISIITFGDGDSSWDARAFYGIFEKNEIRLNFRMKKLFDLYDKNVEINIGCLQRGRFTIGAGHFSSIFRHEIGHLLWADGKDKIRENAKSIFIKTFNRTNKDLIKNSISKYATTSAEECFPECFSMYSSPKYSKGTLNKVFGAGFESTMASIIKK